MNPSSNPALTALGFAPSDRVVIFHADDVGMCQATIPAYQELLVAGVMSSASVMMPCAWSPAAAQVASAHAGSDLGVHLTLTSEWNTCRWRPLTAHPELLDAEGFFPCTVEQAREASAGAVGRELRAQLEMALAWGVDVTHLDAHMGAAADPRYVLEVMKLAAQYHLPFLCPRLDASGWQELGLNATQAAQAAGFTAQLEAQGFPLVDHVRMLPLEVGGDHVELTLAMLRELPPGITHFILHPACDTPELRAIATDFEARVANYEAFRQPVLLRQVQELGVQVIGYRLLRDLLRRTA